MPVTYNACNSRQIYFIYKLCAGAAGIAEIRFEQPVRLLRDYRGFNYRGSRNYFSCCVHFGRFQPTAGLQERFPIVTRHADDTREAPLCTASPR